MLERLWVAREINNAHGWPVVSIWDVDQMDEATIAFFRGVNHDLPAMLEAQQAIDKDFEIWRAEHKYGKYPQ
jgi:hypothetical protein